MGNPPLKTKIIFESSPLKSRILVRRLAISRARTRARARPRARCTGRVRAHVPAEKGAASPSLIILTMVAPCPSSNGHCSYQDAGFCGFNSRLDLIMSKGWNPNKHCVPKHINLERSEYGEPWHEHPHYGQFSN